MTYWFTSDYHLGHANIIKYCKRPFKNLYEMNNTIIRNHNERVKPDDTVFFLGDFCFRNGKKGKVGEGEQTKAEEYLEQLNGNFIFIKGNHDNNNGVKTILESAVINHGGHDIFLVHNPADCDCFFKINFVGHVHEKWKSKLYKNGTILINVGCDVWNYRPITIKEIFKEINKCKVKQNENDN